MEHDDDTHAHPTPLTYIKIATALVILTMLEVAVIYVDAIRSLWIPILVVLSSAKFVLVAMFYMHLKFDNRLFSIFFIGGLILATIVIAALLVLFRVMT
tara:strand:- start:133 stop:429 length:297 start_codon:yes stop_codon:yes gene_type:complete